MNKEIKLFLNYLEKVRNYSDHTVKNYSADLKKFEINSKISKIKLLNQIM